MVESLVDGRWGLGGGFEFLREGRDVEVLPVFVGGELVFASTGEDQAEVDGGVLRDMRWRRWSSWERKALPTPPTPMMAMKMG